jgi:hypothetical protein
LKLEFPQLGRHKYTRNKDCHVEPLLPPTACQRVLLFYVFLLCPALLDKPLLNFHFVTFLFGETPCNAFITDFKFL